MNKDIILDTNVLLTALKSSRGTSFRLLAELAERGGPAQLDRNLVFLSEFSAG